MSKTTTVTNWNTDYDIMDPEYILDPMPIWKEMRQTCPVAHTERHQGSWMPTRYEDMQAFVRMVPDLSSKDPIAIDILVLVHDVTDMDTDRQFNDLVTFQALLDVQRTTNRVNRRGEFHQPAVPHALDNLATVGGHHRFKQFTAQLP